MTNWTEIVANNQVKLLADKSKSAQGILAIFYLFLEFENNGLTGYLMNSSADSLPDLVSIFELSNFTEGLEWLKKVEIQYGGKIHGNRISRINTISELPEFKRGKDPFDTQHNELNLLMPKLETLAISFITKLNLYL